MTCEVVVMNKNGMALAADSAVTLTPHRKVYNHDEKLFQLGQHCPVGILVYGASDMIGVPWATVIKLYRRKLADTCFDHVHEYARDFLAFIESNDALFSLEHQQRHFRSLMRAIWENFVRLLQEDHGESLKDWSSDAWDRLRSEISEDATYWERYDPLESARQGFGDSVVDHYAKILDDLERELFDEADVPGDISAALRRVARDSCDKHWFWPDQRSGIVIGGFGEMEAFPKLVHYEVGAIVDGVLRCSEFEPAEITHDNDANVTPLAQRGMIDLFYEGIHPCIREKLAECCAEAVREVQSVTKAGHPDCPADEAFPSEVVERFTKLVKQQIYDTHTLPLLDSVGALPMRELASLSEALVNLTAFRAHMTADEIQTVGGDVDVALISKGDGFVWVQRKDQGGFLHAESSRSWR